MLSASMSLLVSTIQFLPCRGKLSIRVRVCVAATAVPTNISVCVVTLDIYKSVHGKEPADESNTSVGHVFGWRELDGVVKDFPTDDSEKVFYGDAVVVHDEVHINPCYTW